MRISTHAEFQSTSIKLYAQFRRRAKSKVLGTLP